MARETTDRSTDVYEASHANKTWRIISAGGLALLSLTLVWIFLQYRQLPDSRIRPSIGAFLVFSALLSLLSILFERLLHPFIKGDELRFRVSVLSSAAVGLIFLLPASISRSPFTLSFSDLIPGIFLIFWLLLSAFCGGLIFTTYQQGFVENNLPPSKEIEMRVFERHRQIIGSSAKYPMSKRLFDLSLACFGLIASSPVWLVSAFFIWFENPGPLLFVKNSVGKEGKNFRQYKFRTMIRGAEESTGPVMAAEGDRRVLRIGKLLRKTALDELPQLINILKGEMSFVGPRPQRTIMVDEYLESMPEYAERHRVLPGLAGLAQVVGDYYLTPRQKLRFDRVYINHANLKFDLLLVLLAFQITFWYRWKKDWNGRLPRRLLHKKSYRQNYGEEF